MSSAKASVGGTGNWPVTLLVLLCAVTAGAVLVFSLPWGIGVSPDSVAYLRAAQGLIDDADLHHLPSHWPPAYPLFLVALAQLFTSVKVAALYGQAMLLALNGCLFAGVVFHCLGDALRGRHWLALGAGVYFLTNSNVFMLHQYAISEALFIFFLLAGTISTWWYLKGGGNGRLVAAALLVGCLPVTRYAGIVFIAAFGALIYCCWNARAQAEGRLLKVLQFTAVALLPLFAWLGFNMILRGESTNREFTYHPAGWGHLKDLAAVFISWFRLPGPQALSALVLIAFICSISLSSLARRADTHVRRFVLALCFTALLYVAFIFFSISFLDVYTPVDQRILLPVWVMLYIAVFLSLRETLRFIPLAMVVLFGLLGIGANSIMATAKGINESMTHGLGYHTPAALRSELLAQTRATPRETLVYSNARDYIYLHAGRQVRSLPRIYSPNTRKRNPDFLADMTTIVQKVDEGEAVVVYFHGFEFRRYFPTLEQLQSEFSLHSRATYQDGAYLERWQPEEPARNQRMTTP